MLNDLDELIAELDAPPTETRHALQRLDVELSYLLQEAVAGGLSRQEIADVIDALIAGFREDPAPHWPASSRKYSRGRQAASGGRFNWTSTGVGSKRSRSSSGYFRKGLFSVP